MLSPQGFGLIIGTFGALMSAEQAILLDRAVRSERWPSTTGRVRAKDVMRVRWHAGWLHGPAILYTYTVDGEPYQGQTIDFRTRRHSIVSSELRSAIYLLGRVTPSTRSCGRLGVIHSCSC